MQRKFSLKEARKAKESIIKRKNVKPKSISKGIVKETKIVDTKVNEDNETTAESVSCPKPPKPPVQEIDILRVTKVFQECRVVDTNEIIDEVMAPEGAVDVECLGAELIDCPTCVINPDGTVTVTFSFLTAYQFLDIDGDPVGNVQVIRSDETRTVVLPRAGERGLECLAEVFLECLLCFVSERGPSGEIREVTCCVGKQIVFKLVAEVELRVPTFGYAPEPPECEQVLGECPEFTPQWPPYPPQKIDNDNNQSGCRNCRS